MTALGSTVVHGEVVFCRRALGQVGAHDHQIECALNGNPTRVQAVAIEARSDDLNAAMQRRCCEIQTGRRVTFSKTGGIRA
jgi:hypothetical protein